MFGGLGQSKAPMTLGSQPAASGLSQLNQNALQITLDGLKGTSRFSDLHPDLQRDIEAMDSMIQSHINNCTRVAQSMPKHGENISTVKPDVAYIEQSLSTVELGIENDSIVIAALREQVRKDADEATIAFNASENLNLPKQFHYGNRSTAASGSPATDKDDPTKPVDMMGYFNRRADNLASTLEVYQRQIREIEAHLRTMEAGTVEKAQQLVGSRSGARDQRRELVEALKAIEGAILEAARKVGGTRDGVEQLMLGRAGGILLG
jgi:nucleoporin p58/p45